MKLNKLIKKADDEIFADILKKVEAKMVSPFKKEEAMPEAEEEPMEDGESKVEVEVKEDLNPEDLQKLLDLYNSLKD
jgi:hypothetical protein